MIQTIFSDIGLGLALAIMVGPAFFALLQISIEKGFRSAAQFAIGISLSDAFLIAIVFLGMASFLGKPMVGNIVGLVGGGVLIGIGIHMFLQQYKGHDIKVEAEIKEAVEIERSILLYRLPKFIVPVVKGFLLNLANPATCFFWIFWVGIVSTQYTNDREQLEIFPLIIFFSCTLATILFTDIQKAYIANQLRDKINDRTMKKINIVFCLILMGFGVFLIGRSVYPIIELML